MCPPVVGGRGRSPRPPAFALSGCLLGPENADRSEIAELARLDNAGRRRNYTAWRCMSCTCSLRIVGAQSKGIRESFKGRILFLPFSIIRLRNKIAGHVLAQVVF